MPAPAFRRRAVQERQEGSEEQGKRMRNIVLTGFMGTGKSEVGRLVAQKLCRPFIDVDREIEEEYGMSIPEIFRLHGEGGFRDREAATLRKEAGQSSPPGAGRSSGRRTGMPSIKAE